MPHQGGMGYGYQKRDESSLCKMQAPRNYLESDDPLFLPGMVDTVEELSL